jgi:hypothetical protein
MKTQHENIVSKLTGQVIGAAIAMHREFKQEDKKEKKDARHLIAILLPSLFIL